MTQLRRFVFFTAKYKKKSKFEKNWSDSLIQPTSRTAISNSEGWKKTKLSDFGAYSSSTNNKILKNNYIIVESPIRLIDIKATNRKKKGKGEKNTYAYDVV